VVRCCFAMILCIAVLQSLASQTPSSQGVAPSVSVLLPPNIPSETVQIAYYLDGPFGGHGGYTEQRPGLPSYEVPTSVDGKAANKIRMIVYASGCEIQTFVVPLADDLKVKQEFECQPVPSVVLSGQIVPNELIQDKNTELIIFYVAYWSHRFFGIIDGAVVDFRLATVSPEANGMFQVDLPQLDADAVPSSELRASLRLILNDAKTGNAIAYDLEPEVDEFRSEDRRLGIQPYYPSGLKFTPNKANSSGIKCKVFRSDSDEAISNSYIVLENAWGEHFDVRTSGEGEYLFDKTPPGSLVRKSKLIQSVLWLPEVMPGRSSHEKDAKH
jgi:hypothetical protein